MLKNTLTIYDLISTLEELRDEYGEDTPVVVSSDYGDYTHTEQLLEISEISTTNPKNSGYSRSGFAFNDEELEEGKKLVIVIRGVL
jgi:hypothetical protein